jgi:MFS family permease
MSRYLLSFLDRSNIGNAKLEGLVADLGITDFNTLLTVFFIAYVLAEVPSNLVLKVTSPQIWLPTITLIWGIVTVTMGLTHNQAGIYTARIFLGIVEAGLFPGVVYTFSTYYKRRERTARVSFFFSAAAASGAFGGVLAYGLSQITAGGKPRWAWIFIIEGLITIVVSIVSYYVVPSWPAKARHFTAREKAVIQHRLQFDSDAFESQQFEWSEVARAFKSPQVYGYAFLFHGFAFALYTLSLFLPTIILDLGYQSWEAQLLSVPPYVSAFIATMTTAWVSNKLQSRAPFIIGAGFLAIIGYIALLTSPTPGGQYVAVFICTAGVYSGNALLLAWPSENLMGHTYRATGLAMVIMIGDVGAVIGTELYRIPLGSLANKKYKYSHIFAIVWLLIGILAASGLYLGLQRQNRQWDQDPAQRDQQQPDLPPIQSISGKPFVGIVDEKTRAWHRTFRYQL